ncbi:valine--tRNA ligase [Eubacteriales bacterium OttesenSCG-928-M02]|nr:valine--tRNA ligase [Eubacteriales bacterium OttesenSCG-928-M02]
MKREMERVYDPKRVEDRLYADWMEKGYFHAVVNEEKTPYTIVIPPPNITGQLHMGHALDNVVQDILIRTKRMQGYEALWMPGTDHASIATEVKIVEQMAEEGLTKEGIGREAFLARAWEWKEVYGGRIVEQLKKLGSSCDWERERFTMDEGLSNAVKEVFIRLYEKGLIYKGNRIINWCPDCLSALSDIEVEYEEEDGKLWYIRYPEMDGGQGVVIATTRPETMLGDTAVAVNPGDERYAHLIGKTLRLPLMDREIPVVADDYVDMEFGTGAVKITPAHDPNDFEVGQRHNLPILRVMDDSAVINELGGEYQGLGRMEARAAIVADLEAQGLLLKVEERPHSVGHCYRCGTVVEPITSDQWFVKMAPLAEPAINAVRDGRIQFVPKRFEKIYFNWMENVRDWCISRQLWWGHRIPAYYCDDCGEIMVAREAPAACTKCGGSRIRQDEDVLDTWFSSGLWPFSTLGWPEQTPELEYFYPTDVLVTGHEIIFFWVARMIVFGLEVMGDIPFDTVMIHGIVRDDQGRKMSKSLNNGIDPLIVIDEYGTDALRLSLILNNSMESDMRFYREKVENCRNFANKLWNAARFVLMNGEGMEPKPLSQLTLLDEDKWILERLDRAIDEVSRGVERYDLGLAAQAAYDFLWDDYCDWYIEMTKSRFDGPGKEAAISVLLYALEGALKLLHPFIPFITEEIYQSLPGKEGSIMVSSWPEKLGLDDGAAYDRVQGMMELIRAIRNLRREMNITGGKRADIYILPVMGREDAFTVMPEYFARLAMAEGVTIIQNENELPDGCVSALSGWGQAFMPLGQLIDVEKERERLAKEKEKIDKEMARARGMLENPGFVGKAPAHVVQQERDRLAELEGMLERILAQEEALG